MITVLFLGNDDLGPDVLCANQYAAMFLWLRHVLVLAILAAPAIGLVLPKRLASAQDIVTNALAHMAYDASSTSVDVDLSFLQSRVNSTAAQLGQEVPELTRSQELFDVLQSYNPSGAVLGACCS